MFLIISIITINGIKAAGVPMGTRWARKLVILLIILNIINLNQKGKANARVIARWLVEVNVYENRPSVLLNRIKRNREMNKMILIFFVFNNVLNSVFILSVIFLIMILKGEFIIQKEGINRHAKPKSLIQFRESPNKDTGSKIEKRLFIIFSCGY